MSSSKQLGFQDLYFLNFGTCILILEFLLQWFFWLIKLVQTIYFFHRNREIWSVKIRDCFFVKVRCEQNKTSDSLWQFVTSNHQTTNFVFHNLFHKIFLSLSIWNRKQTFYWSQTDFFSVLDQWKVCILFQMLKPKPWIRKVRMQRGHLLAEKRTILETL